MHKEEACKEKVERGGGVSKESEEEERRGRVRRTEGH